MKNTETYNGDEKENRYSRRGGKGTGRDAHGGFNVLLDSLKQRLCERATGDAVRNARSAIPGIEMFCCKCGDGNHL